MTFLLDTNVVSELRKRDPHPRVLVWFAAVPSADLYLSVLVVGEIRRGIENLRRRDPLQASRIEVWLEAMVRNTTERILPVTVEIAEEWGRMSVPRTLPTIDGLLAATARVHGLTLVTRNVVDVAGLGVPLLNPFDLE